MEKLRSCGVGCWVGQHFFGALAYADDVAILCPTISGLQKMIKTCEDFAKDWDLAFNSQKSICVAFSRRPRIVTIPMSLNGESLAWCRSVKYLGNYVSQDLREEEEISKKRGELFGRTNTLMATAQGTPDLVKSKLFLAQCCHLYGAEAWSLTDKDVPQMLTAINRCIRRIFDLPMRTHRRFLPIFAQCRPFADQIVSRMKKLSQKMKLSTRPVKFLARKCLHDCSSIAYGNMHAAHEFSQVVTSEDRAIVQAINELRNCPPEFLTADEISSFIFFLCTE